MKLPCYDEFSTENKKVFIIWKFVKWNCINLFLINRLCGSQKYFIKQKMLLYERFSEL